MFEKSSSPLASIRDVLVGATAEGQRQEASSAVGYGVTLAKAAGAHLTVRSSSWHLSGDDVWLSKLDYEGKEVDYRRLDALAHSIADSAAGGIEQADVMCAIEAPSLSHSDVVNQLAAQARLHDLTILDAGPRTFDLDRKTIEKALFLSGRPVIAVPPGYAAFATQRVVVAWDGSAQAARAANDAMPFLRAAEAVKIVAVGEEEEIQGSPLGAELAPHLARHGVNVTVNDTSVSGGVADTLRAEAALFLADMIVMGAYHHSRVQEYFFGGVTRSLLARSAIPLFLAH
ncbi:universal stress protein [Methylobacterium oxalidis]|uniref:universal stress protein n=1 Tax=Methylobacterium oxalidis TaxID=944322 RepID=UPI0011BDEB19|nr:universal stress protein [Methylobacterium oxalidis]GJE33995.1 hypothetical protein LDDCCGHA_4199 [Methylobacterium oxalidis]